MGAGDIGAWAGDQSWRPNDTVGGDARWPPTRTFPRRSPSGSAPCAFPDPQLFMASRSSSATRPNAEVSPLDSGRNMLEALRARGVDRVPRGHPCPVAGARRALRPRCSTSCTAAVGRTVCCRAPLESLRVPYTGLGRARPGPDHGLRVRTKQVWIAKARRRRGFAAFRRMARRPARGGGLGRILLAIVKPSHEGPVGDATRVFDHRPAGCDRTGCPLRRRAGIEQLIEGGELPSASRTGRPCPASRSTPGASFYDYHAKLRGRGHPVPCARASMAKRRRHVGELALRAFLPPTPRAGARWTYVITSANRLLMNTTPNDQPLAGAQRPRAVHRLPRAVLAHSRNLLPRGRAPGMRGALILRLTARPSRSPAWCRWWVSLTTGSPPTAGRCSRRLKTEFRPRRHRVRAAAAGGLDARLGWANGLGWARPSTGPALPGCCSAVAELPLGAEGQARRWPDTWWWCRVYEQQPYAHWMATA